MIKCDQVIIEDVNGNELRIPDDDVVGTFVVTVIKDKYHYDVNTYSDNKLFRELEFQKRNVISFEIVGRKESQ